MGKGLSPLLETSDVTPPPHGVKTYTIVGEGKPPAIFSSGTCTSSYASAMIQHNLQPSEPLAYDPHTANTIHPGNWSMTSVFSALISSHFVTVSS